MLIYIISVYKQRTLKKTTSKWMGSPLSISTLLPLLLLFVQSPSNSWRNRQTFAIFNVNHTSLLSQCNYPLNVHNKTTCILWGSILRGGVGAGGFVGAISLCSWGWRYAKCIKTFLFPFSCFFGSIFSTWLAFWFDGWSATVFAVVFMAGGFSGLAACAVSKFCLVFSVTLLSLFVCVAFWADENWVALAGLGIADRFTFSWMPENDMNVIMPSISTLSL